MLIPDGLEFAARTDTGLVRTQNEDAIVINPAHGFAILADGMGGYSAGEVASSIAIQVASQYIEHGLQEMRTAQPGTAALPQQAVHHVVTEAFQRANTAILDAAHAEPQYRGMGTTLVAAVFQTDLLTVAHVGDSRAYRLREGVLEQITRDHSLLQEQIDAGLVSPESAPYAPHRNLVTRAVGIDTAMDVEIHDHPIEAGDLYLLCSDGLSDMLPHQHIADVLMHAADSLDGMCTHLLDAANRSGGHDNISVILIKVQAHSPERVNLFGRMFAWTRQV